MDIGSFTAGVATVGRPIFEPHRYSVVWAPVLFSCVDRPAMDASLEIERYCRRVIGFLASEQSSFTRRFNWKENAAVLLLRLIPVRMWMRNNATDGSFMGNGFFDAL